MGSDGWIIECRSLSLDLRELWRIWANAPGFKQICWPIGGVAGSDWTRRTDDERQEHYTAAVTRAIERRRRRHGVPFEYQSRHGSYQRRSRTELAKSLAMTFESPRHQATPEIVASSWEAWQVCANHDHPKSQHSRIRSGDGMAFEYTKVDVTRRGAPSATSTG